MNILNKLVIINLKKNKQRTIVSIIGIILSCAMITALFGLVVSLQESLIQESINDYGYRHVTFEDVPKEDIETIQSHKNVASYYLSNTKVARKNEQLFGVTGLDKTALESLKNKILNGNIPINKNEIVVDTVYAARNDITVGDKITVTTGQRRHEGNILNEQNPYIEGETLEDTTTKEYKVVGISEYYSYLSSVYKNEFYVYDNQVADVVDMYVVYENPKDYSVTTAQINGTKTDQEVGKYNFSYNTEYLRWTGYGIGNHTQTVLKSVGAIISFIIMIASVFCIRNTFTISVSEKTRTFGMLSSIGATPKQIKRTVLKEASYLGIIGIPLGILSGLFASYILIIITEKILLSIDNSAFDLNYKISIEAILLAIILSIITIYLSAIKSAKRASKITEIEAIKNQKDITIQGKKLKTPKIIKTLFKTGGMLAYKNMKRNKSKYKTTIIALAISITTFVSISYFIDVGLNQAGNLFGQMKFNMSVNTSSNEPLELELEKEIYHHIAEFDYIDQYSILRSKMITLDDTITDNHPNIMKQAYVFCVNDEEYERYLQATKLKQEDVINKGIIISNTYQRTDESGKTIIKKIIDEKVQNMNYSDYQKVYQGNMDIIFNDEKFMGEENFNYQGALTILVSKEHFEKIDLPQYYDGIYIHSNNSNELQKLIEQYQSEIDIDLNVNNIAELVKVNNTMVLLVSIFLYGFITVITLIGITNIFNTITTNMMLRKREFAILKSTGMTNKEFINMIKLESIFYGFKSLFYGLILGNLLSYTLYRSFKDSDSFVLVDQFNPPYLAIAISIICVFILIYVIMRYSLSKIKKQNIIETIRDENI